MKKFLKNSALLLAAASALIIIFNKLNSLAAGVGSYLSPDRGHMYKWKYGNVYYIKTGRGKPVLLIHDLDAASSAYEWNKVIKKLSASHTVYAIDLIGCGRSDKPALTYTNFLFVQLINDFIKNIIGKKTSVAATGDSLSFVIMGCRMEPDCYDKIIGISPTNLSDLAKCPGKIRSMVKFLVELPVIGTFIYNFAVNRQHIKENLSRYYFHKPHLVSEELINAYYYSAHLGGGNGRYLFAGIKSRYTNINIIPALKAVNNSIFLIGGREHPCMGDIINEYKEFNPSIESAFVASSCCLPQLEAPGKFSELLAIILDS